MTWAAALLARLKRAWTWCAHHPKVTAALALLGGILAMLLRIRLLEGQRDAARADAELQRHETESAVRETKVEAAETNAQRAETEADASETSAAEHGRTAAEEAAHGNELLDKWRKGRANP